MKKSFLIISLLAINFIGCGNDDKSSSSSNDESANFLSSENESLTFKKKLKIVGLPYYNIVNICQDYNNNRICDSFEYQKYIKINIDSNGEYLFETQDPMKPILLEYQDKENIPINDGKFYIPYKGFKNYYDYETKDLSILTSMEDNGYLKEEDTFGIKNLYNLEAQSKFYDVLLKGLEKNINILLENGTVSNSNDIVLQSLKEISIGLLRDGIDDDLPRDLDNCGTDIVCIESRLDITEKQIVISANTNDTSTKKLVPIRKTTTLYQSNQPEETSVTTYEYDGNKLLSSYRSDGEYCRYYYDNNRFVGKLCENNYESTSSEVKFLYSNDKIIEEKVYEDGLLDKYYINTEWNSDDLPTFSKIISYDEYGNKEETEGTRTIKYFNGNPTYVAVKYVDNSAEAELDFIMSFDDKKSPFYWTLIGGEYLDNIGILKNNLEKLSANLSYTDYYNNEYGNKTLFSQYTTHIDYNELDMPTKVDFYLEDTSKDRAYFITTYEYKEIE